MNANRALENNRNGGASVPLSIGYLALTILFFGLWVWGLNARIAGAIIAPGIVQVESNRQVIQHPDGGVVGKILAKDGDTVTQGQVLLGFDETRVRSELSILENQLIEIQVRSARLVAERDDLPEIEFSSELEARVNENPRTRGQLDGQTRLFEARKSAQSQESDLLHEQVAQVLIRISGVNAQVSALQIQADLVDEELQTKETLLKRGLVQTSGVRELRGKRAAILGQIGKLTADVAEMRGQMAGTKIELLKIRSYSHQEAITALRELQFKEIEISERQRSISETLSRMEVRAPVGGIVYGSQVFALQSVVQPGVPMMYIIPQDQPMIVAARVDTLSIDQVHVGQEASLRFTVFDEERTPEILGYVSKISADVITPDTGGFSYYAIEVLPKESELAKLGDNVLLPGMPVETYIVTGQRTPLAYLAKPLTDYFARAFRE